MSACAKPNHISIADTAKPQNDVEGPRAHEFDGVERYMERYIEGSMERMGRLLPTYDFGGYKTFSDVEIILKGKETQNQIFPPSLLEYS